MIQSIVQRWPLLSPIFQVAYEFRVEKTGHLLRLSTNRSNFLLLHKTGSAGQPGRVPSKQVIVRGSNVWRIRRVGYDFSFQRFQVCLDHFRNMGSSIVMLQNHFIVSLVVLQLFVFQCSAQTHQLRSIPIACVCFSHNTLRRSGPTKYRA